MPHKGNLKKKYTNAQKGRAAALKQMIEQSNYTAVVKIIGCLSIDGADWFEMVGCLSKDVMYDLLEMAIEQSNYIVAVKIIGRLFIGGADWPEIVASSTTTASGITKVAERDHIACGLSEDVMYGLLKAAIEGQSYTDVVRIVGGIKNPEHYEYIVHKKESGWYSSVCNSGSLISIVSSLMQCEFSVKVLKLLLAKFLGQISPDMLTEHVKVIDSNSVSNTSVHKRGFVPMKFFHAKPKTVRHSPLRLCIKNGYYEALSEMIAIVGIKYLTVLRDEPISNDALSDPDSQIQSQIDLAVIKATGIITKKIVSGEVEKPSSDQEALCIKYKATVVEILLNESSNDLEKLISSLDPEQPLGRILWAQRGVHVDRPNSITRIHKKIADLVFDKIIKECLTHEDSLASLALDDEVHDADGGVKTLCLNDLLIRHKEVLRDKLLGQQSIPVVNAALSEETLIGGIICKQRGVGLFAPTKTRSVVLLEEHREQLEVAHGGRGVIMRAVAWPPYQFAL